MFSCLQVEAEFSVLRCSIENVDIYFILNISKMSINTNSEVRLPTNNKNTLMNDGMLVIKILFCLLLCGVNENIPLY